MRNTLLTLPEDAKQFKDSFEAAQEENRKFFPKEETSGGKEPAPAAES